MAKKTARARLAARNKRIASGPGWSGSWSTSDHPETLGNPPLVRVDCLVWGPKPIHQENTLPLNDPVSLHVEFTNKVDHPDHPDQASDSAPLRGPGQEITPDHPGPIDVTRAVVAYAGYWPLKISTLCRAIAAQRYPLASTPIHEFLDRLDAITPEFENFVRWAAQQAINSRAIPPRAVSFKSEKSRPDPHSDPRPPDEPPPDFDDLF